MEELNYIYKNCIYNNIYVFIIDYLVTYTTPCVPRNEISKSCIMRIQ